MADMRRIVRLLACMALPGILLPGPALAQPALSQTQLEADCQRRLRLLVPPDVKAGAATFSALGSQPAYYVVTWQYSGELRNGQRRAACTYRRNGDWANDDAHAFALARELARRQPGRAAP